MATQVFFGNERKFFLGTILRRALLQEFSSTEFCNFAVSRRMRILAAVSQQLQTANEPVVASPGKSTLARCAEQRPECHMLPLPFISPAVSLPAQFFHLDGDPPQLGRQIKGEKISLPATARPGHLLPLVPATRMGPIPR